MGDRRALQAILALWTVVIYVAGPQSSWATPLSRLEVDIERFPWTHLVFEAKRFLVSVNVDARIDSVATPEAERSWLVSPRGEALPAPTPETRYLRVDLTIDPLFRSPVRLSTQVWFDSRDATALARTRLSRGEDDYEKRYRFTSEGVYRWAREPNGREEASREPDSWTRVKESYYRYDLAHLGCPSVTEASLLTYIASVVDLGKIDDAMSLCVFGKRQLHRVQLRNAGKQSIEVGYLRKTGNNETKKEGTVEAIRLTFVSQPLPSELKDDENLSFFGLHGDVTIYVDPSFHVPIQVSGTLPTVGNADLKLKEVRLRNGRD